MNNNFEKKSWLEKYKTSMQMCFPFRLSRERDKTSLSDEKIGCFSYMSMNWFNGYMWKASRTGLQTEDIKNIKPRNGVEVNSTKLHRLWEEEIAERGYDNASLLRTICKFNRTRLIVAVVMMCLMSSLHYIGQTWMLLKLLEYLNTPEQPLWKGIVWAVAVSLGQLFRHIAYSAFWVTCVYAGIKLFGALQGVIYDKILLSKTSGEIQIAKVINYCTTDLERIYQLMQSSLLSVASLVCWIFNIVYCYNLMGPWSLLGNLVVILYYPLMMWVAKSTGKIRAKAAKITDKRIGLMNQLLSNIKFIKTMAWEDTIFTSVKDVRDREARIIRYATFVQSFSWSTAPIIGVLAPMVTIVGHLLAGETLNAPQVFTLIAAYGALSFPLNTLTIAAKSFSEGVISCRRIQEMLKPKRKSHIQTTVKDDSGNPIVLTNVDAGWDDFDEGQANLEAKSNGDLSTQNLSSSKANLVSEETKTFCGIVNEAGPSAQLPSNKPPSVIQNINLNLHKGQLVGICGQVGSGKSTLLSTIIGSANIYKGNANVNGSVALVTQQAWIFSGTVRQNIVFGLPFDKEWYQHVVQSCSLEKDFKLMANKDQTQIGERGANLSGGQKQRINLARALYSRRDIYLLDDPLSAVDVKIAKHIFKNGIQKDLETKTVVLVTHAVKFLKHCDYIILMKNGKIVEQGTHDSLVKNDEEYTQMVLTTDEQNQEQSQQLDQSLKRVLSAFQNDNEDNENQVSSEKIEKTSVSFSTFLYFCRSCGGYILSMMVPLTILLYNLALMFHNIWLKMWLDGQFNSNETLQVNSTIENQENVIGSGGPHFHFYFWIYISSLAGSILFGFFKGLAIVTALQRGAATLHWAMFWRVLRSPMSFFDTTPLGQIINRFSRDMDELDTSIPYFSEFVAQILLLVLLQIIVICVIYPWFSFAIIGIAAIFVIYDKVLIGGIRETKRIDNSLKPPVIDQLSTTAQGLEVIKCFDKQKFVTEKFKNLVEKHLTAYLLFQLSSKWLSFRADLIGWVAVTAMAFMTVFTRTPQSAVNGGLAMTQILLACNTLTVAMRWKSELQAKLVSIERVSNYSRSLNVEAPSKIQNSHLSDRWPSEGKIEFINVYLKYSSDGPLILHGLNVMIRGGEKVGIIGRTGAGKSSVISALLRLTETLSGKIMIDEMDISQIGLEDLRSKMAVIPQEPVLLDGTIRWNLDPTNKYTDEELWNALEKSHLRSKISKEINGLDTLFTSESGILSVGERQLFCLARALLKQSKILLLDEATANVDFETDNLIQKSIRGSFGYCTVLTIAHRLNTISDYDKILTLDSGKVIEFDTPVNLMARNSHYRSMMNTQ